MAAAKPPIVIFNQRLGFFVLEPVWITFHKILALIYRKREQPTTSPARRRRFWFEPVGAAPCRGRYSHVAYMSEYLDSVCLSSVN